MGECGEQTLLVDERHTAAAESLDDESAVPRIDVYVHNIRRNTGVEFDNGDTFIEYIAQVKRRCRSGLYICRIPINGNIRRADAAEGIITDGVELLCSIAADDAPAKGEHDAGAA